MLTMAIGKSKDFFFDREAVVKAMDAASKKALSKGGAFVMRGARKSIKPAKTEQTRDAKGRFSFKRSIPSKPGEPPRSHTGLLRDRIYFAADLRVAGSPSVVIGPERIASGGEAPSALEFGGRSTVTVGRKGKRQRKSVQIAARPYMGPALQREAPKLPEQFRNSVVRRA